MVKIMTSALYHREGSTEAAAQPATRESTGDRYGSDDTCTTLEKPHPLAMQGMPEVLHDTLASPSQLTISAV